MMFMTVLSRPYDSGVKCKDWLFGIERTVLNLLLMTALLAAHLTQSKS